MPQISISDVFKNTVFSYWNKLAIVGAGFLYVLIVANYLGPEKYGLLSFLLDFLASGAMLLGFSAISESIIVFVSKNPSRRSAHGLLKFGFAFGLLFSILIFLFPGTVISIIGKGTEDIVRIMSAVIFLNIATTLLASFLTARKTFGKLLILGITENLLNLALCAVFLLYFHGGIEHVLYAKIISLLVTGILAWKFSSEIRLTAQEPNWGEIKKFAFNSGLLGFLRRISSQVLLILMTMFVSPAMLGFYYIIQKIGSYVIDLPVTSLNDVLLPLSSEHSGDRDKLTKIISLSTKLYIIASIGFSLFLIFAGPFILEYFFPEYIGAAPLIPLFAVYFLMTFDMPLGTFFRAIRRNDVLVAGSAIMLIGTIVFGYFLVQSYGVLGVVLTLIITRFLQLSYEYYFIVSNDYKIEFWPRPRDIKFFAESLFRLCGGAIKRQTFGIFKTKK